MPKVSDIYAGDFVTAGQLPTDHRITALITSVVAETVGNIKPTVKLVLELRTTAGVPWPRRLPLNRRNALALANAFGDDADAWINQMIELWSEPTTFDGQPTMGVVVAAVGNGRTADTAIAIPPPTKSSSPGDLDDEIPWLGQRGE